MPSGERIQFANNVNFIFECHSLQYASPATVSRCGMLLMSNQHNNVQNLLAAWLSAQPPNQAGGSLALPQALPVWGCWKASFLRLMHSLAIVFCPSLKVGASFASLVITHYMAVLATALTVAHALADQLQQWLQSAFLPAMKYVQTLSQVVEAPFVTTVRNALSHVTDVGTKHEFACGLFHGLAANVEEAGRQGLALEISRLTGEPNVLSSAAMADPSALLRFLLARSVTVVVLL